MSNRVAVTGMGIISPLGNSIENFWNSIKNGKNGIKKISQFDTSNYPVHIAGECDIDLKSYIDAKQLNKIDRFTAFAIIAAKQAIKNSNITPENINKEKAGLL